MIARCCGIGMPGMQHAEMERGRELLHTGRTQWWLPLVGVVLIVGSVMLCNAQPRVYHPAGLPGGSGSILRLHLDAARAASVDLDGSAVQEWRDVSGHVHDLVQSDTVRRPVWSGQALGTGRTGIEFGAGRGLAVGDDAALSATDMSVVAVLAIGTTSQEYRFIGKGQAHGGTYALVCDAGGVLRLSVDEGGGWQDVVDPGTIASQTPTLVVGTVSSSEAALYKGSDMNACAVRAMGGPPADMDDDTRLGDPEGSIAGGVLGEVLIYGKVLGLTERALLMNYARARWGVAVDNAVAWYYSSTHMHELLGVARLGASDHVTASASTSGGMQVSSGTARGAFLQDNGDAMLVAHDGNAAGVQSLANVTSYPWRWSRTWSLQKTDVTGSAGGAVTIGFHFPSYHGSSWSSPDSSVQYGLVYNATDPAFTSGNTLVQATVTVSGESVVIALNANLLSTGYYTLAAGTAGALCHGAIAGSGASVSGCIGNVVMHAGASATLADSAMLVGTLVLHDNADLSLGAQSRLHVRGQIVMRGGSVSGSGDIHYETGSALRYGDSELSTEIVTSGELTATQAPSLVRISTRDTVRLGASVTVNGILFDSTGSTLDLGTRTLVLRASMRGPGLIRSKRGRLLLDVVAQSAGNIGGPTVETLEIDAPGGVTCTGSISVLDTLRLHAGVVQTGAHAIVMDDNAVLEGESHARYVQGRVQVTRRIDAMQTDFGGIGLELDARSDSLGIVVCTRHAGAAILQQGNASIARWWRVEPQRQPTAGIPVTVTWRQAEMNGADPSRLQPWRSTDSGATWNRVTGPELIASISDSIATVSFMTPGFSDFTVTDADSPLPVELVTFTALRRNGRVTLRWMTATESNSALFIVERRNDASMNAADVGEAVEGSSSAWHVVSQLPAAGTSSVPRTYVSRDDLPMDRASDVLIYRLRQIDRDGSEQVFPEVRLPADQTNVTIPSVEIFPNPVFDVCRVRVVLSDDGPLVVSVLDAAGRIVRNITDHAWHAAGGHLLQCNMQDLPGGSYFISVEAAGVRQLRRVLRW